MAVRKADTKQWTKNMHDGAFESAESQAWNLAAKAEIARHDGNVFMAAFLDCVKCYEVLEHQLAYDATVAEGCDPAIADMSFDVYRKTRTVQVHGAATELIAPERGILAGCGIAVHHLKASVNHRLDVPDLTDYVDDLTVHTVQDTVEQAVISIDQTLSYMNEAVPGMGPNLSVKKEQIFFNKIGCKKLWMKIRPEYEGKVSKHAKQLGCTLRGPNSSSITKGPKVEEACKLARNIWGTACWFHH